LNELPNDSVNGRKGGKKKKDGLVSNLSIRPDQGERERERERGSPSVFIVPVIAGRANLPDLLLDARHLHGRKIIRSQMNQPSRESRWPPQTGKRKKKKNKYIIKERIKLKIHVGRGWIER
jgi:hypothetical protein